MVDLVRVIFVIYLIDAVGCVKFEHVFVIADSELGVYHFVRRNIDPPCNRQLVGYGIEGGRGLRKDVGGCFDCQRLA